MPPKQVRTIRQLIYWEFAKLIAERAVGDRKNYRFVMHTYKRLETGRLHPSSILRENKLLAEGDRACAYCGREGTLQWEHIIPRSRGGPDTIDNQVLACPPCNAAKGGRAPFEWYGLAQRELEPLLQQVVQAADQRTGLRRGRALLARFRDRFPAGGGDHGAVRPDPLAATGGGGCAGQRCAGRLPQRVRQAPAAGDAGRDHRGAAAAGLRCRRPRREPDAPALPAAHPGGGGRCCPNSTCTGRPGGTASRPCAGCSARRRRCRPGRSRGGGRPGRCHTPHRSRVCGTGGEACASRRTGEPTPGAVSEASQPDVRDRVPDAGIASRGRGRRPGGVPPVAPGGPRRHRQFRSLADDDGHPDRGRPAPRARGGA